MYQLSQKNSAVDLRKLRRYTPLVCLAWLTSLAALPVQAEQPPVVARATVNDTTVSKVKDLAHTASVNAKDLVQQQEEQALFALAPEPVQAQLLDPASTPLELAQQAKPSQAPAAGSTDGTDETDLLEDVTVTGTLTRRPELETPTTVYTVDRKDIEATGASTVNDVLKLIPNVTALASLGGVNSETSTYIRGLDTRRILFLIDGAPIIRAADNRAADIGRTPVVNVERIEVITGGATLKYSSDAIAGVINVITQVPSGPPKVRVNTTNGSFGYSQYRIDLSGSNGIGKDQEGFFGYNLGYERRSALNNFSGNYYQDPVGAGIQVANSISFLDPDGFAKIFPEFDPKKGAQIGSLQLFQNPVKIPSVTSGAYTFNDFYYSKFVYKPAVDHTITFNFTQLNSHLGDQFALPNAANKCYIVPPPQVLGGNLYRILPIATNPFRNLVQKLNDSGSGDQALYNLQQLAAQGDQNAQQIVKGYALCTYLPQYTAPVYNASFGGFVTPASQYSTFGGLGDQREDDTSARFAWDWKINKTDTLSAQFSYYGSFFDYPSALGTQFVSSRSMDGQLRYTAQPLDDFSLNMGAEFTTLRYNAVPELGAGPDGVPRNVPGNSVGFILYFPYDREINRWSVFFTGELKSPDKAFTLDFGARMTNDNYFGTYTTPGVAMRYNFSGSSEPEPVSLRANWTASVKTPGLAQLFGYGASNTSLPQDYYAPNPYLKPELGTVYDIGLDIKLSPTSLLRATYYRVDIKNYLLDNVFVNLDNIPGAPNDVVAPFITINTQAYRSSGWEFAFDWQIIPELGFKLASAITDAQPVGDQLSDTYTDPTTGKVRPVPDAGVQSGYYYGYNALDVPFNSTTVSLRYGTPSGFNVALTGQLIGRRPRLYGNNYYPDYAKWDLTFKAPISRNVALTGGVFSIFNDQSPLADSSFKLGTLLSPPTSFRIGVEATFDVASSFGKEGSSEGK